MQITSLKLCKLMKSFPCSEEGKEKKKNLLKGIQKSSPELCLPKSTGSSPGAVCGLAYKFGVQSGALKELGDKGITSVLVRLV